MNIHPDFVIAVFPAFGAGFQAGSRKARTVLTPPFKWVSLLDVLAANGLFLGALLSVFLANY